MPGGLPPHLTNIKASTAGIGNTRGMRLQCVMPAMLFVLSAPLLAAGGLAAGGLAEPARAAELVRLVRQDCGSCHGLTLKGGLGPALLPENLADKPPESLVATILHGRPGTPMPPWKGLLSEEEAEWIVYRLRAGFPQESALTGSSSGK